MNFNILVYWLYWKLYFLQIHSFILKYYLFPILYYRLKCGLNYLVIISRFQKVDYISYLTTFDHLFDIPKDRKNSEYRKYLESLLEYLYDYIQRIKPLLDLSAEIELVQKQFLAAWEAGTFPGWPVSVPCILQDQCRLRSQSLICPSWFKKETGSALAHVGAHLDLSAFSSWEELASLGLDRLKSALMALGLKCGG